MKEHIRPRLFSIGDCPVCASSGAVLVLRPKSTAKMVFFCPFCEVAWQSMPSERELNEVQSLADLAPSGVTLPELEEVVAAAPGRSIREIHYSEWEDELKPHLGT